MRWSHNQPHTVEAHTWMPSYGGILHWARYHKMRINGGPMMDTGFYATLETCTVLLRLAVGEMNI